MSEIKEEPKNLEEKDLKQEIKDVVEKEEVKDKDEDYILPNELEEVQDFKKIKKKELKIRLEKAGVNVEKKKKDELIKIYKSLMGHNEIPEKKIPTKKELDQISGKYLAIINMQLISSIFSLTNYLKYTDIEPAISNEILHESEKSCEDNWTEILKSEECPDIIKKLNNPFLNLALTNLTIVKNIMIKSKVKKLSDKLSKK